MQLKPMRVGRIQLYTTGLDAEERRVTGVELVHSLDQAIADSVARHGDPAVAVIPEGPYVVPVYRRPRGMTLIHLDAGRRCRRRHVRGGAARCVPGTEGSRCSPTRRRCFLPRADPPMLEEGDSGGIRALRFGLSPERAEHGGPASHGSYRALVGADRGGATVAGHRARRRSRCSPSWRRRRRAFTASPVDDVHFHEIAGWDSLVDMVAAGSIAAALDGARWTVSPLPRGGGTGADRARPAAGAGAGDRPDP